MAPKLNGIDHIHIYAPDREAAARWYEDVLDLTPDPATAIWAEDPSGPLTVQDATGNVHLAIFRAPTPKPQSFAFQVSGEAYEGWIAHLGEKGITFRERDHDLTWSIYINDPFENQLEFTTWDHAYISQRR